jgi:HK97 family phage prohead protease
MTIKKTQSLKREVRSSLAPQKFEVRKNADGTRTVSGYFATFGTLSYDLDGFKERILPGAFSQSLKDKPDVLCYYNHNADSILGRVSSGTLAVSEDSKGLRFSVTLPDTSYASDLISLMTRGDVNSCSFGFTTDKDSWNEDANGNLIRTLEQVTLWEGSIVGSSAYPNTVADLRSCPSALRSKLRAKKRDDSPSDNYEQRCDCECTECLDGDCSECTDPDCDDSDGCEGCPMQDDSRADRHRVRTLCALRMS